MVKAGRVHTRSNGEVSCRAGGEGEGGGSNWTPRPASKPTKRTGKKGTLAENWLVWLVPRWKPGRMGFHVVLILPAAQPWGPSFCRHGKDGGSFCNILLRGREIYWCWQIIEIFPRWYSLRLLVERNVSGFFPWNCNLQWIALHCHWDKCCGKKSQKRKFNSYIYSAGTTISYCCDCWLFAVFSMQRESEINESTPSLQKKPLFFSGDFLCEQGKAAPNDLLYQRKQAQMRLRACVAYDQRTIFKPQYLIYLSNQFPLFRNNIYLLSSSVLCSKWIVSFRDWKESTVVFWKGFCVFEKKRHNNDCQRWHSLRVNSPPPDRKAWNNACKPKRI